MIKINKSDLATQPGYFCALKVADISNYLYIYYTYITLNNRHDLSSPGKDQYINAGKDFKLNDTINLKNQFPIEPGEYMVLQYQTIQNFFPNLPYLP